MAVGVTVLVLAPHPDDAEWYAGGTLAGLARAGARVILIIATDGSIGSLDETGPALVARRAAEAERAASVLGAQPPVWLGHADFELDRLPAGVLRAEFVRAIRTYRPAIVFAEDAQAVNETHPDHLATARAAAEALAFAHLPGLCPQHAAEGLAPHWVAEKYFYADAAPGQNRWVDIGPTLEIKLAALAEHRSQMVFMTEEMRRQARLAGLDWDAWLRQVGGDEMAAIAWGLRGHAAEMGRRAGLTYAEAFRYERFHPLIEQMIGGSDTIEGG